MSPQYHPITAAKTAYEKGVELLDRAAELEATDPVLAGELRDLAKDYFKIDIKRKTTTTMSPKQQSTFGIIAGVSLLLILLIIALLVPCPSNFLVIVSRVILALAGAAFAIVIPGILQINKGVITAGGALGVFVLIYLWNPAPIDSFSNCPPQLDKLEGSVSLGDKPLENVQLSFLEIDKRTNTNVSGNFLLEVSEAEFPEMLRVQLISSNIQLDTILRFAKADLKNRLDIILNAYCTTCEQFDQEGKLVNRQEKCSASYQYIKDYQRGFMQASAEQNLEGSCK